MERGHISNYQNISKAIPHPAAPSRSQCVSVYDRPLERPVFNNLLYGLKVFKTATDS